MDIFKIIRKNNVELLKDTLRTDENLLYSKDSFGSNVLHKAIFWNCNEIVDYLKDDKRLRSETDNDGFTVYHKASLSNNKDAVMLLGSGELLLNRNKAGELPFGLASRMNHQPVLNTMLEFVECKNKDAILKLLDKPTPGFIYQLNKKFPIDEPMELYPRDDLIDPYTLEDIVPGTLYALRSNNGKHYCLGTAETIDAMMKTKYKSNNENMVFDMVWNQLVPIDSILFTYKNDCPGSIRKIFNKTFTEKDIDLELKDKNYQDRNQLAFATIYFNKDAIMLIENAMKKD